MRPASIIDQMPEPPFDHEGTRDDVNEASGQSKHFNLIQFIFIILNIHKSILSY